MIMIDSCGSVHCHLSFMFESCVLFCVTDKFVVEISDHIMLFVFKNDKRRQIKKGRKFNTRLSTCT